MTHVSIIGTGNMGQAISAIVTAGGNTVELFDTSDAGLRAVDAGGLRRARELEALGFLQLTLAVREKITWTGGFAVAA